MEMTGQEVEKAISDLTNALAAEQDKTKILAEQKAGLLEAAKDFVNKVETGRARSKDSYAKFKQAIKQANK